MWSCKLLKLLRVIDRRGWSKQPSILFMVVTKSFEADRGGIGNALFHACHFLKVYSRVYRIVGIFRMVQNFAFFVDRLGTTKIKPRNLKWVEKTWCHSCIWCNRSTWVWSWRWEGAKIKTTKISSEGLTCNSAKLCTGENFPLYGMRGKEREYRTPYCRVQKHPLPSTEVNLYLITTTTATSYELSIARMVLWSHTWIRYHNSCAIVILVIPECVTMTAVLALVILVSLTSILGKGCLHTAV